MKMVKVEECCCGCTLRTGSLILLWVLLVYQCISILQYSVILSLGEVFQHVPTKSEVLHDSLDLIISIIGATVSILGIYGIQKDRGEYLSGGYYFFCYKALRSLIELVFFIVSPPLYDALFAVSSPTSDSILTAKMMFPVVFAYLFCIALLWYFTLVLKSYRDDMLAKNKDERIAKMPDLSAVGYRNAV